MRFLKANIVVDIIALFTFIISGGSGIVIGFIFSGPYDPNATILSITRSLWNSIHDYSSLLLIAFVVIHFILHISWIKEIPMMLNAEKEIKDNGNKKRTSV